MEGHGQVSELHFDWITISEFLAVYKVKTQKVPHFCQSCF
jgi:hypothetical protein